MSSTDAEFRTPEEFLDSYRPDFARGAQGYELLYAALCNSELTHRVAIANRLLDDGARADGRPLRRTEHSLAQILLGRIRDRRPDLLAPLLRRLFEAGCDVNHVHGRDGTVVQSLAKPTMDEAELAPYYDVVFAQPDIDLLSITSHGRSDLELVRRWARPALIERAETYLRDRGIEPPLGTVFDVADWGSAEQILAVYRPEDATAVDPRTGRTLLHLVVHAIGCHEVGLHHRLPTQLADRLLDDGADPAAVSPEEGLTPAHLLLSHRARRSPPHADREQAIRDAPLLHRLLTEGGDVNAVAQGGVKGAGTPLLCLARDLGRNEADLEPLYDVLLSHPDLDLSVKVGRSKTVADLINEARPRPRMLIERLAALVDADATGTPAGSPDLGDPKAVRAHIDALTAPGYAASAAEWAWLNRVMVEGDVALRSKVVPHLMAADATTGERRVTEEAFEALMSDWPRIYGKAPSWARATDLLRALGERDDPRLVDVLESCSKRRGYVFYASASSYLAEFGGPGAIEMLYRLAQRPGKYVHTPGDRTALLAWVRQRASHEGRTELEIIREALADAAFDEAARRALVEHAVEAVPPEEREALASTLPVLPE